MFPSSILHGLLVVALLTTAAAAQDKPADSASQPDTGDATGDNPFRAWRLAVEQQSLKSPSAIGYGGMEMPEAMLGSEYPGGPGMPGAGGYGGAAGPGGASGFGYAGGYSGAAGYAGEYGGAASPSELFQQAVHDSVQRLAQAKTDAEKQQLIEAVRVAFHERYQQALAQRQQELDRLDKQLQRLREDLERRRAAEKKVIEVQLRTIELAGEGLLQLGGN